MRKDKRTENLKPTRIGQLFLESPLTQRELAQKIGCPPVQIHNWTWGTSAPSCEGLIKIAKGMNVSADYLLGLTDNRGHSDTPLKDLLEEHNLSMNRLAKDMGIHRQTIARVLHGQYCDAKTIVRIADYFGVTTDFLLRR